MPSPIKFGTDGWRGLIAEDFTFPNVRACAQGVAQYLRDRGLADRGLVVGYDTRFLSDRFAEAVARVLAADFVVGHGWSETRALDLGRQVLRGNVETIFGGVS